MLKENDSNKESPIRWIIGATKPYHGVVLLLVVLAATSAGIGLWNAVLLKNLIDAATDGNRELLIRIAVILLLVTFASVGLSLFSRYLRERTSYRLLNGLQTRLFSVLLSKDYYNVTRAHSQEWMNRFINDPITVSDATTTMVPGVIGIAFTFVGAIYLLIKAAPSFLVFVIIGGALLVAINYALKNPLKQAQRSFRDSAGRRDVYISEHLSKLMIVKAFNRESVTKENSAEKLEDTLLCRMCRLRLLLMKDAVQNGATKLAYLAVLIYCANKIIHGEISYGTCVMLLRLLSQIRAPLTDVSKYLSNIFDVSVAAERLMEAEAFADDPEFPVKSDEETYEFYENDLQEIVFEDAGFSYLDELEVNPNIRPTVFEHVDMTIPKGSLVAFTGITGSGKSTLFKLLLSLYPLQEGRIMLRCNDGSETPLDATYRRLFAYVPQGNQLMVGTVREMVSFGDKDAKDSDLWAVLETSCAKDFVEELPQGLDTQIGERGLGLSEGQMQRLAVARALYTKRPILLLDEATSSLDEATEQQLLENIKAMTDCTVLIVTHRPAALSICDMEVRIDGNSVYKI